MLKSLIQSQNKKNKNLIMFHLQKVIRFKMILINTKVAPPMILTKKLTILKKKKLSKTTNKLKSREQNTKLMGMVMIIHPLIAQIIN